MIEDSETQDGKVDGKEKRMLRGREVETLGQRAVENRR